MTFRVETLFDQTHTCSTGHDDPDHITDRDLRTWTCSPPSRRLPVPSDGLPRCAGDRRATGDPAQRIRAWQLCVPRAG
ncbi:hypothetical protein FA457_20840 [Pseudomonas aeruginosa]|nr:hypothetical protein [Pseudomonas aeruginosa]MCO1814676.1 hypothetical protein [Pseudomonas aeruginosa]